jgi:putative endopeptidase
MMVRVNGVLEVSEKVLGKGMLRDWWSEEMVTRFNTQAKCVVDCYDKYEVEPGLYIRGNVTEGENIADLGK